MKGLCHLCCNLPRDSEAVVSLLFSADAVGQEIEVASEDAFDLSLSFTMAKLALNGCHSVD